MRPVYILDLDGTILSTNSFPHWVLYLMRAPFPRVGPVRRLSISSSAAAMLMQRKLRLTGHERFKWRLQKLWRRATEGDGGAGAQAFVDRMIGYVRPELSPVLSAVACGRIDAILATAAPADYAHPLGCAVGFLACPRNRFGPCGGRAQQCRRQKMRGGAALPGQPRLAASASDTVHRS